MPPTADVIWAPQPGPQRALLACPVREVFFGGARGGGKTQAVAGDWMAHEAEHGEDARGVIFRRIGESLADFWELSLKLFPPLGAQWHGHKREWRFPSGAVLRFRHLRDLKAASAYKGHEYTWMTFEEADEWPDPGPVDYLRGCLRSAAGVPTRMLLTGNPGGVGHQWLKARYIDPAPPFEPFDDPETGARRVFIPSRIEDNRILLENDPDYVTSLHSVGSPELVRAWVEGDWDVQLGAYFADVWNSDVHVIEPFEIPSGWYVNRAHDWGSARPSATGWFAESDGTEATLSDGTKLSWPRGTVVAVAELYTWNGKPNEGARFTASELARRIKEAEATSSILKGRTVHPGPADSAIYSAGKDGRSIADDMLLEGVRWTAAEKGPGTRETGWQLIRQRLRAALADPPEEPGLYFFSTCRHALRTIPSAPRDDRNPEDVDTDAEDHWLDMLRYRLMAQRPKPATSESYY